MDPCFKAFVNNEYDFEFVKIIVLKVKMMDSGGVFDTVE